jgi:hypothetical protein
MSISRRPPASISLVGILLLAIAVPPTHGDGCFWAELGASGPVELSSLPLEEQAQRGFVYLDVATGYEAIVLEAETEAVSSGFAWIVPLPYIPASVDERADVVEIPVSSPDDDLFALAALLSRPSIEVTKHYYSVGFGGWNGGFSCTCAVPLDGMVGEMDQTEEESLSDWLVDIWVAGSTLDFEYVHISATSAQEIASWMYDNGYGHISLDARAVMQEYCDGGASFLIMTGREDSQSVGHTRVTIGFPTTRPFFPLAISRIGFGEEMHLGLYVCSTEPYGPLDTMATDFLLSYLYNTEQTVTLPRAGTEEADMIFYQNGERDWFTLLSEETAASAAFEQDVSLKVRELRGDVFWQDAALELDRSEQPGLFAAIENSLPPGRTVPDSLWINSFAKTYTERSSMEDLFFVARPQAPFRGAAYVHVDIERTSAEETEPLHADASAVFALLFLLWLRGRGRYLRKRQG